MIHHDPERFHLEEDEIERELRRLWEFLVDVHALGRPREAVPPR